MHKQAWLGELPSMVRDYRFKRGFVHWVQVMSKNFLAHGEELFALAPIRQVTINDINSYLDDVAASPHLARLEGLDIKPEFSWRQTDYPASLLTDEGLERLLGAHQIHEVGALDVGYNNLTDLSVGFLAMVRKLRRLDIGHNTVTGTNFNFLGASWGVESLLELSINNNPYTTFPAEDLASQPGFQNLRSLHAEMANLSAEGLLRIASGKSLLQLSRLYLDGNPIGSDAIRETLGGDNASRLTTLSLNSVALDGDALGEAVGASQRLVSMRRLSLRHNQVGSAGAEALAAASIPSLSLLDLRDNAIGDAGCAAIANSPTLANLTTLLLAENSIGDPGAFALAKSPYLERIVEMRLGNNPIGSAARFALQSRFGHRVIFDS